MSRGWFFVVPIDPKSQQSKLLRGDYVALASMILSAVTLLV
jgi:hypothetical protein